MSAKQKSRLDILLVERGLFSSRQLAQASIMEGRILIDGQKVEKAGHAVPIDCEIQILGEEMPYVSRGGLKLKGALEHFQIVVHGFRCLDLGASTGGFTDCLLQNGAMEVVALDVGKGQLHEKLRKDTRVEIRDGINARNIDNTTFDRPFDLVVVDVSFISQKLVIKQIIPHLKDAGIIIALIKPQFEAGRDKVGKGGIVRDPETHQAVIDDINQFYLDNKLDVIGVVESSIFGADGNKEFLIAARKRK